MRVLSLFDGISCGRVALKRANKNVEMYYSSEVDKYAKAITIKNHPDTFHLGDVRTVNKPPNIDLLIGGSPCQGFSFAGKQLNFDDERSKLFFEFVRILEQTKPKYFMLENVPMKKEFQNIISSHLGVEPMVFNSSLVSAQNRKRLFWTNIPVKEPPEDKGIVLSDILENEVDDKYFVNSDRTLQILENETKKGKIGYIGKDQQGYRIYSIHGKSITICSNGGGMGAKTGLYWIPVMSVNRLNKSQNGNRFKPSNAKFYTLTTKDQHGVLINGQIRRLTPTECERLQTLEDGYTAGLSDSRRYMLLGNAWTVDIVSHIFKHLK